MRAFIAVELEPEVRSRLGALQDDLRRMVASTPDVRISWTRPDTIHLTLKFLGDVDASLAPALRDLLAPQVPAPPSIAWPLERLGAFPNPRAPRTLWAGAPPAWEASEDRAHLLQLHRVIDEASARLGVAPDDRPFAPHLTIARVRSGERAIGRALSQSGLLERRLDLGSVAIRSVSLMKSRLDPAGAVHTPIWHLP